MEFILLLAAGVAIYALWRKFEGLERELWQLSAEVDSLRRSHDPAPRSEPPPPLAHVEPVTTRAAASIVASKRAEPSTSALGELSGDLEPGPPPAEPAATSDTPSGAADPRRSGLAFEFDFEDIFGRRLPIWAGGVALAVAGIFLVRYSIEAGLITPAVRVALSFLFGFVLLALAELAFRLERRLRDPRVRQALAGAGLATLLGAFYLAGTQYALIGAGGAFLGLAAVTAASIALSFRFGLPCAILGLVGGFAAPVMVNSDSPNIPLLALYLALVTGGLAYAGRAQKRPWLGYAALLAGLVWGVALLASGPADATANVLAVGLYLLALGSTMPAFLHADEGPSVPRIAAGGVATLQMAVLVEQAGFGLLTWGLYLLLGAAFAFFGWRDVRLRIAASIAAGIAVILLALWSQPSGRDFALVGTGLALVFAAVPLAMQWRGHARLAELVQLALVAPTLAALAFWHFGGWGDQPDTGLALAFAALALLPAVGAWLAWHGDDDARHPVGLPILLASTSTILFCALLLVTPGWSAPLCAASVSLALWLLARQRNADSLRALVWIGAVIGVMALIATPAFLPEADRLAGDDTEVLVVRALARWFVVAVPFFALTLLPVRPAERHMAEAAAALFGYGLAAQALPGDTLAWAAVMAALALALLARLPGRQHMGAVGMLLAIAGLWAFTPFFQWLGGGALAMAGVPLLADHVPTWRDVLLHLLPFACGCGALGWRLGGGLMQRTLWISGAITAIAALHSLWKLVFAISSIDMFEQIGLGERSLWEAMLLAFALALFARGRGAAMRITAWALLVASLAHFVWFTVLLHNPLWARQEVGPLVLANWLLLAYGLAALGIVTARRRLAEELTWLTAKPRRLLDVVLDAALMGLILLFALSSIRHAFTGSLFAGAEVGQTETLLYSLTGIVLAIGYLLWGARGGGRRWRIGSLVLMLGAVFKVFLADTAGLEGLLRIASFLALGISLIGIGWFYSRQLSGKPAP